MSKYKTYNEEFKETIKEVQDLRYKLIEQYRKENENQAHEKIIEKEQFKILLADLDLSLKEMNAHLCFSDTRKMVRNDLKDLYSRIKKHYKTNNTLLFFISGMRELEGTELEYDARDITDEMDARYEFKFKFDRMRMSISVNPEIKSILVDYKKIRDLYTEHFELEKEETLILSGHKECRKCGDYVPMRRVICDVCLTLYSGETKRVKQLRKYKKYILKIPDEQKKELIFGHPI